MRKFLINVNGNSYEVEVEEIGTATSPSAAPSAPAPPVLQPACHAVIVDADKAKAPDGYDDHQRHHDLWAQSEWKEGDAKIQNGDRQDHGLNQIPKLKESHDAPRVRKVCRNVVDLIIHPNPPPRLLIADPDIAAAFLSARQGIARGS